MKAAMLYAKIHNYGGSVMSRSFILLSVPLIMVFVLCNCGGNTDSANSIASDPKVADFTNSIGMKMIRIPGGVHSKVLYVSESPVTVSAYKQYLITSSASMTSGERAALEFWVDDLEKKEFSDYPMVGVTWYRATEFCKWLSKNEHKKYRLPSVAEWKVFCQAGSDKDFFFGNNPSELGNYGWYKRNSEDELHPVRKKKPNPYGLYDIYGNVWEWCKDEVPRNLVEQADYNDECAYLKGGAFFSSAQSCMASHKWAFVPRTEEDKTTGFRIVCEFGED